ncbi:hypothetical protein I6A84_06820 [Frankia sp. CNm7]|uniref:Uncharacterized protein n=1 Tax=Frankia nepalensis TaxID=1836974 RepID=A0A937RK00_9ACTN|nr:hypothetical protein [Frankia nepalensis]MBL7500123.1 hypothetical protein [Frankia nepalensis]MBL7511155.1 hypothetical protein [Frankia nepalensis]MBL7517844.1 hypothetical protein [Frankia nepalensis]MBL7631567.1 hypothetical protein [Frankia nepalensis]
MGDGTDPAGHHAPAAAPRGAALDADGPRATPARADGLTVDDTRIRQAAGPAPWHGAVTIGLFFAAAGTLITYTLLPLPGQRAFGAGNYWLAGGLFAAHLLVSRLVRLRVVRAAGGG